MKKAGKISTFFVIVFGACALFAFLMDATGTNHYASETTANSAYNSTNTYSTNAATTTNATNTTSTTTRQVNDPSAVNENGFPYSYEQEKNPSGKSKEFQWEMTTGQTRTMTLMLVTKAYNYYTEVKHVNNSDNIWNYVNDAYNKEQVKIIADSFRKSQTKYGWSDAQTIREVIRFVQAGISYTSDSNGEYYKFPIETLYDRSGDCEDQSILMVALIRQMGYDARFLYLPGHCAVVVAGESSISGTYYNHDGKRFYYLESTCVCELGQVPDNMQDKINDARIIDPK